MASILRAMLECAVFSFHMILLLVTIHYRSSIGCVTTITMRCMTIHRALEESPKILGG